MRKKDPKKPATKKTSKTADVLASAAEPMQAGDLLPGSEWYGQVRMLVETLHAGGTFRDVTLPVATVKLLKGRELGIYPLQALKHIWITDAGEPVADSAELQRALIARRGFSIIPIEMTPERCVVRATRGQIVQDFTYTIQEARQAGLVRPGTFWVSDPTAMNFARASTRAARAVFSDVIAGLSYTAEEMGMGSELPHRTAPVPAGAAVAAETRAEPPVPPVEPSAGQPGPTAPPAAATPPRTDPTALPLVDGRQAVQMVTITVGGQVKSLPSCGITAGQLMATQAIVMKDPDRLTPRWHAWLKERGLTKPTALTEPEAREFIVYLQQPAENGAAATSPPSEPTAEEARQVAVAAFEALMTELGLEEHPQEMRVIAASILRLESFEELSAEQVVQVTNEIRDLARTSGVQSLRVAIDRARQYV